MGSGEKLGLIGCLYFLGLPYTNNPDVMLVCLSRML